MPLAKFGAEDLEEKMESVFGAVVADPQQTLAMPADLIDQRPEFVLLAYVDLVHAYGLDSGKIAVLDSIFHDPLHGSIHVGPSHAEASGDLGPREQTCPLGKEKTENIADLMLAAGPRHSLNGRSALGTVNPPGRVNQLHGQAPQRDKVPSAFELPVVSRPLASTP